ncbi:hypothetical protein FHPHGOJG_02719 [Mannheimia haemolytica]|uniref:hypothetical protein n=1 Tax=Mannheimia haemolytica TaxID=75985 RepID=UPI0019E30471|nr:hypothetical protein [Mannheimia haemolytica]
MKKIILLTTIMVSACTTQYKQDYTTKPTFCYQLAPQEQLPGKTVLAQEGIQVNKVIKS